MNELLKQEPDFSIVPHLVRKEFQKRVLDWYECVEAFPEIKNNMLHVDRDAQVVFLDFLLEIEEYYFAESHFPQHFKPEVFPIEKTDDWFEKEEKFTEQWIEGFHINEMCLYLDIKRILNKFHMAYSDSYQYDMGYLGDDRTLDLSKLTFHNMPIKGVW